jgi:hypothetical protein
MHMSADRIRHNLKQVVDRTAAHWRESTDDDDLSMLALSGRQPVSSRHQRHVEEHVTDIRSWRGKGGKENAYRSHKSRASTDLDIA